LKAFSPRAKLTDMKSLVWTTFLVLLISGSISCSKESAEAKKVDVQAMIGALKGEDKEGRINACVELAKAGRLAKPAVPFLVPLLKDKDPLARRLAAYALGEIGPDAQSALSDLKGLVNDQDRTVSMQVINSLRSIDPKNYSGLKTETTSPPP
jgi:HEAT repeat protein